MVLKVQYFVIFLKLSSTDLWTATFRLSGQPHGTAYVSRQLFNPCPAPAKWRE